MVCVNCCTGQLKQANKYKYCDRCDIGEANKRRRYEAITLCFNYDVKTHANTHVLCFLIVF